MRGIVLVGALAVLAIVSAPAAASADSATGYGYVCRVAYTPQATGLIVLAGPTMGDFGTVTFALYTGANCTGSYVRTVTAYSAGSNVATYTNNATTYGEAALLALWQSLQRAAESGERVFFSGSTWSTPPLFSGTQLSFVRFSDY